MLDLERAAMSPYPGLRPFQPQDADYFFGRESQVREVIQRLRTNRFVAVIGGSGSGKSSLILAGAIPGLRSFAIEESGDFWIPVVCTPGTNHIAGDNPIRRLARKFCAQLKANNSEEDRLSECVSLLAEPNGLRKIVERFGRDLHSDDGVDLSRPEVKINFLFLIDQFEELFHPSNNSPEIATECTRLVSRIIDQFRSKDAQVCVALTMRSEHLNDCPRYPDLPDAINAASYLVKRLNDEQLEEVIRRPAQEFLRGQCSRERAIKRYGNPDVSNEVKAPWPHDVVFQERLVERLLEDLHGLLGQTDHADHLPLLQHALFWTWAHAIERTPQWRLPDSLILEDLLSAACVKKGEDVNTLVACLENRSEGIYTSSEEKRERWEKIFRRLAFKEPNTGTYTQQRCSMEALCGDGSSEKTEQELHSLLEPWLYPHGYLHWDVESHTVKVAHETLIRRWSQLRRWIDQEDRQFHAYLRLLEDCTRWKESGSSPRFLASGDALQRYQLAKLLEALRDSGRVQRFNDLLAMHRDRESVRDATALAVEFLEKSVARMKHEQTEAARREERDQKAREERKITRLALATFSVVSLLFAGFVFVQWKMLDLYKGYALVGETQAQFQPQFKNFEKMLLPMRNVLIASRIKGSNIGMVGAVWDFPETVRNLAETSTYSGLKMVLTGAAWKVPGRRAEVSQSARRCEMGFDKASATFFPGNVATNGVGIVVAFTAWGLSISTGELGGEGEGEIAGKCAVRDQLMFVASPTADEMSVGVSQDLSNIFIESERVVSEYAVVRDAKEVSLRSRFVVNRAGSRGIQGKRTAAWLPSAPARFSTDVLWRGSWLRLFDVEPTYIVENSVPAEEVRKLGKNEAHPCRSLPAKNSAVDIYVDNAAPDADGRICLLVVTDLGRGEPRAIVSLYSVKGKLTAANGDKQRASLVFDAGLPGEIDFRIDSKNEWLAFHQGGHSWRAVTWGLDSLAALANEVFSFSIKSKQVASDVGDLSAADVYNAVIKQTMGSTSQMPEEMTNSSATPLGAERVTRFPFKDSSLFAKQMTVQEVGR